MTSHIVEPPTLEEAAGNALCVKARWFPPGSLDVTIEEHHHNFEDRPAVMTLCAGESAPIPAGFAKGAFLVLYVSRSADPDRTKGDEWGYCVKKRFKDQPPLHHVVVIEKETGAVVGACSVEHPPSCKCAEGSSFSFYPL